VPVLVLVLVLEVVSVLVLVSVLILVSVLVLLVAVVGLPLGQGPTAVGAKPGTQRDNEEEPEEEPGPPEPGGGLHDTLNSVTADNAAVIHPSARIFI
jgi:hypothetical protein